MTQRIDWGRTTRQRDVYQYARARHGAEKRAADAKLKCLGASFQLFQIPHAEASVIGARQIEAGKVRRIDSARKKRRGRKGASEGRCAPNGVAAAAAVEGENEDRGARNAACRFASGRRVDK